MIDPTADGEVGQIVVKKSQKSHRRISTAMVATLVSVCVLVSGATAKAGDLSPPAQENRVAPALAAESAPPPPSSPAAVAPAAFAPLAPTQPPQSNPALDLRTPVPEQPSILGRWWFWTAVGVAAAATVAIIVVSSRGNAPPATDLGNQEFKP
ncbi:MAG TPA: hypothetical protein VF524_01360 [Polyangia bacterium]